MTKEEFRKRIIRAREKYLAEEVVKELEEYENGKDNL